MTGPGPDNQPSPITDEMIDKEIEKSRRRPMYLLGGLALVVIIALVIAVVVLATAGGDDSSDSAAPSASSMSPVATATEEFPMSGLQEYQTVKEIQTDLRKGGIVCYDLTLRSGTFAAQMGACDFEGQELVLSTFADDVTQRQAQNALSDLEEITGGYGFVSGGNWLVNCGKKAVCLDVQAVLGGRAEYPFGQ